jgi:hypothetical protein
MRARIQPVLSQHAVFIVRLQELRLYLPVEHYLDRGARVRQKLSVRSVVI